MNWKSFALGVISTVVIGLVMSCSPGQMESRTLLHKGTVERINDGELDEQYSSVTRIEIFTDGTQIVDASIHMIAVHRGEALLLKDGEWEIFNHMIPRVSPIDTPSTSPLDGP